MTDFEVDERGRLLLAGHDQEGRLAAMLVSFAIGTLLFATTAFADIATKSGYDQLKDALKMTAENCSDKFNN